MNSLNILSGFTATPATTPPSTPPSRSRTGSSADINTQAHDSTADFGSIAEKLGEKVAWMGRAQDSDERERRGEQRIKLEPEDDDEKKPLLARDASDEQDGQHKGGWRIHRRLAEAIINSAVTVVRVVYTTLTAPKRWVVACFYDEDGQFSAMMPFRQFRALMVGRRRRKSAVQGLAGEHAAEVAINEDFDHQPQSEKPKREPKPPRRTSSRRSPSISSISSATSDATSEGEPETEADRISDSPARHTRSKTSAAASRDEIKPHNKSIRIKLHAPTDPALQRRKERKAQGKATSDSSSSSTTLANSLKSPSSPTTSNPKTLTRYPRTPAPPRPLVPRRQPSYSLTYSTETPRKTLVIDLDETLIHSMAKGGRMSQGHMVEVRLSYTSPATSPVTSSGPVTPPPSIQGVPILYYVHERPYVHEFLRKIAKWYTLIIFTASVQEYADPVIDYLERERKYFSGRYYRQHCTFRNGAYIKDLTAVEPDLSRVMILDNSPMSYIFHEDNALPIEGWISDPTDRELLHLVSLLEGLQYVTDVRALLALRQGLPGGFAQQA